jgi:hypothetical protein
LVSSSETARCANASFGRAAKSLVPPWIAL